MPSTGFGKVWSEETHMNESQRQKLGQYVGQRRRALGLSIRGLAATAGVDASGLSRLERGRTGDPGLAYLHKLSRGLEVDPTDLYVMAGYTEGDQLPGFAPYLRAKYELPPEAVDQLSAYFDFVNARYVKTNDRKGENHDRHHS